MSNRLINFLFFSISLLVTMIFLMKIVLGYGVQKRVKMCVEISGKKLASKQPRFVEVDESILSEVATHTLKKNPPQKVFNLQTKE